MSLHTSPAAHLMTSVLRDKAARHLQSCKGLCPLSVHTSDCESLFCGTALKQRAVIVHAGASTEAQMLCA